MQFLVLGPLEVTAGGRAVRLPAAKHRTLLAALLVRADQAVSADGLIEALWDGQPPASAAKTLQTYVSQLRRELEPTAAAGDWRVLRTADDGYRLYVDQDMLDARRFGRLVEEGRRALRGAQPASAAAWLSEGLALWRGPPMASWPSRRSPVPKRPGSKNSGWRRWNGERKPSWRSALMPSSSVTLRTW